VSNYLAIATVTATLRYMLQSTLPPDLSGAAVTTLRPDAALSTADATGINIFLYQVLPNAALRNCDLPTRRSDGTLVQRPRIALDLNYLLTFYGNDAELEPQRLLGSAACTLNAAPVLSAEEIGQALLNSQPFNAPPFNAPPFTTPPYQPDLAMQVERVNLTMLPLSLEELSKLWSVFYQIPFALTMAWQASVVLIEQEAMTPQAALPVQSWTVTAMSFNSPAITGVVSQSGALQPITAGSTVLIQGTNLRNTGLSVLIAGYSTALTPTIVSDTVLSVALPTDVPAGVRSLQIAQSVMLGVPAVAHTGSLSNAQGFVLIPVISVPVTGSSTQVVINLQPTALAGQTAVLLLNEATSPPPVSPAAYSFSLGPLSADSSTITFPITGVTTGITYFVRIQIDGAQSALNLDSSSSTYGPTVAIA
jgi:hypothetical protein